jgi:hypothetical protein
MRRFEHLAGVERVSVGVVVVKTLGCLLEDGGGIFAQRGFGVLWEMAEAGVELLLGFGDALEEVYFRVRGVRKRHGLHRSAGNEAEFHGEAKDDGEHKSDGRKGRGAVEFFSEHLDEEDQNEEDGGDQETIPDKDAYGSDRSGRASSTGALQDALNMEGRGEAADGEDDEEEDELEKGDEDFFHRDGSGLTVSDCNG